MKSGLNFVSLFFFIIFSLNLFENSFAGGLYGGKSVAYTTTQVNFRDQQSATGFVRMTNGFTLAAAPSGKVGSTHGASLYMDTCLSVSGAIDLRDTNTIILLSDLKLDNGVTFSFGGRIYGYDRAVILNGDFTVPTGSVIHIGGRIAIDGQGNKLILGKSSQIFVDAGSTLTLRNLVLQNTQNNPGNPPILCGAGGTAAYCSNLCLDNVELALTGNFYFNRGQMFIHNDVAVTGTSALVYRSCQPSFITSGAHLYFDVGTTFSFAPATFTDCPYSVASTTTTNNFIHMADATSTLILNGSSFFTTTTGLRLTTGTVLFDNRVTLQSKASSDISPISAATLIGTSNIGSVPNSLAWSPDGRFVAVLNQSSNTLQIFSVTNGIPSTNPIRIVTGLSTPQSVIWSPDGRFLAVISSSTSLQIFSFTGGNLNTNPIGVVSGLTSPRSVTWSPDGRFIAVVSLTASKLQIFSFNGSGNPVQVTTGTGVTTGTSPISVAWSPDGRFIAVANEGAAALQVFNFSGSGNPISVGTVTTGSQPFSVSWSPDGRFIAVVNNLGNSLQIFSFYGGNPALAGTATGFNQPRSVTWSPDGRFIAATSVGSSGSNGLEIFGFNGFGSPTLLGTLTTGSGPESVAWSPDGKFIAVINNTTPGTVQVFGVNYIVSQTPQALSNSIVFGNSALGSSYDAIVRGLAGSQMAIDGLINYDCVS